MGFTVPDAHLLALHAHQGQVDGRGRDYYLAHLRPIAEAHLWYEEPTAGPGALTGRVDLKAVPVAPGTRAYLCGPLPFMRAVREQLLEQGVRPADIHYEVFGPDLWLEIGRAHV